MYDVFGGLVIVSIAMYLGSTAAVPGLAVLTEQRPIDVDTSDGKLIWVDLPFFHQHSKTRLKYPRISHSQR